MEKAALIVEAIGPVEAAQVLRQLAGCDPLKNKTVQDIDRMCESSQCFRVSVGDSFAVYALQVQGDKVGVVAAAGSGDDFDMTTAMDLVISEQCQGARAVFAHTARAGLVRKLKKQNWRVVGWVLEKAL